MGQYRIVSWIYPQPFKPYVKMANTLEQSVKEHGYGFTLCKATAEEVGACLVRNKLYIRCQGRPKFLREMLDKHPEDLVWMDLDTVIVKPLGNVLNDCDCAFTIRKIEDRHSDKMEIFKYLNCGVMFFKNNEQARKLIDLWQESMGEQDDQAALNNLLLKYSHLEKYDEVIDVEGVKVKILDARIYNFFYFPEEHDEAKVLHYKGFSFKREKIYD